MNDNQEIVYYSMKHELKKSFYFFSRFNSLDLIFCGSIGVISYLTLAFLIIPNVDLFGLFLLAVLVFVIAFSTVLLVVPIEIYHNGLGFMICMIKYFISRENKNIVWGGINYGFESLQAEKERRTKGQERAKYRR